MKGKRFKEEQIIRAAEDPVQYPSWEPINLMKQLEKEYPVVIAQDVIWGDMDAFGHINNTVYFRYFEDARSSILSLKTFNMEYATFSEKHGSIAAEGEGLTVYYDYANGKSCEIPRAIVAAIEALEG